jgi:hypothetical protein
MTSIDVTTVDGVVRQMLDAIRNAHLQTALGQPARALDYLHDAAGAHERLEILFQGDSDNEALAGRILYRVIEQRIASLGALVQECLTSPMSADDVLAQVSKPHEPSYLTK